MQTVTIADGHPRTVTFTSDLSNQALKRDEQDNQGTNGDPHEIWYRFGGKLIGYVGNNGTIETDDPASITDRTATQGTGAFHNGSTTSVAAADFDQGYNPINSYGQGSAASFYTAQDGDRLI